MVEGVFKQKSLSATKKRSRCVRSLMASLYGCYTSMLLSLYGFMYESDEYKILEKKLNR